LEWTLSKLCESVSPQRNIFVSVLIGWCRTGRGGRARRRAAFLGHGPVVGVPVVVLAAGIGEDLSEQ
jgi:hypothetical protein